MRTAVEISLYPLDADYVPPIKDFIERLNRHAGLQVITNAMSTQVAGEHELVFAALMAETRATFAGESSRGVRHESARRHAHLGRTLNLAELLAGVSRRHRRSNGSRSCWRSATCCLRSGRARGAGPSRLRVPRCTSSCSRAVAWSCRRGCRFSTSAWRSMAGVPGGALATAPPLAVSRWPAAWHAAAIVADRRRLRHCTARCWAIRRRIAWVPYADACIAWGSVFATLLETRKILETWLYWIVLDAAAAVLYASQGLHATAILFLLYSALAVRGYLRWRSDAAWPAVPANA